MKLRDTLSRVTRCVSDAPSLRQRFAATRAKVRRLVQRPSGDLDVKRRAVMAGSLGGAAFALMPAVAQAASPISSENPELLALVAPLRAAFAAFKAAKAARKEARPLYHALRPKRPAVLYSNAPGNHIFIREREEDAEGQIPDASGSYANPRYVLTVKNLCWGMQDCSPRTKRHRLARERLVVAEKYEAAERAARERSGIARAVAEEEATREHLEAAAVAFMKVPAGTVHGIALKAGLIQDIRCIFHFSDVWLISVGGRTFAAEVAAVLGDPLRSTAA